MSSALRDLQRKPDRLNWKSSWKKLKEAIQMKIDATHIDDPADAVRSTYMKEILDEMKLIESGVE